MKILLKGASIIDKVNWVCGVSTSIVCYFLCFALMYEVFMRYFFIKPTTWANELSTYSLVYIVFVGLGYAMLTRSHIRVELLIQHLKKRSQLLLDTIVLTLAAFFYLVPFLLMGIRAVLQVVQSGETPCGGGIELPFKYTYWMLPFGATLLLLQIMSELVKEYSEEYLEKKGLKPEKREGEPLLP